MRTGQQLVWYGTNRWVVDAVVYAITDVQAGVVEHISRHFHTGPPLALREFESMMVVRAREL
eukprot:scaffold244866_cov17-Prasinocladus_malaysianus.AAC.1